MRFARFFALAATLLMAAAPARASTGGDTASAAPAAPLERLVEVPLLIDPSDLGLGITVTFRGVPNARELTDLDYFDTIQHVVLDLPGWPEDSGALDPLTQVPLPQGADLIVLLRGWPPTHAAAGAWNLLRRPVRIILLVDGPPADRGMILEMNSLHGLERVIATMAYPSRSGFERLQRPVSFRVLR